MIFPADSVDFLQNLANNNQKNWFDANKKAYEKTVKEPAKNFAAAVTHGLEELLEPPFEHKVFRINRDLRFSKDKTPYNTHMRFAFWQNTTAKPMATPAYYLSIEPSSWMLGAGCLQMPAPMLTAFRTKLKSTDQASKLNNLTTALLATGMELSEPELKRTPHGIEPTHPEAIHMRRKGIVCWHKQEQAKPTDITATQILTTATAMAPFYRWLRALE